MKRIAPIRGRYERGFALVAAIFIVVILALLGIMMVTIGGMQRATATTAAQGTRAFYAARAGIEWATANVIIPPGTAATRAATCGAPPTPPVTQSATTTSNFTLTAAGLNNFNVSVTCFYTLHQEHGAPYNIYAITSTATSGNFGDADFVSRTLNATATDASAP
jgi:MSHA biogenesis protein MshP